MSLAKGERKAIVDYRLEKCENTFSDVIKATEYGMYNTAANRLYYSFYYVASALLISNGITAHTHSGLQSMIHLHFIKTGLLSVDDGVLMRRVFSLRQESDYDDFVILTAEDICPLLPKVRLLIDKLKSLIDIRVSP